MKKLKRVDVFTMRIVYKSGYVHDFTCRTFKVTDGTSFVWSGTSIKNRPITIGADDIAAVWQIGHSNKWVYE